MFFCRMKGTKTYLMVLCAFAVILLIVAGMIVFCFSSTPSNDFYFNKIRSLRAESQIYKVEDVFDFDFDKAYISEQYAETYADWGFFAKKLNIDTKIDVNPLPSEDYNRILFIKDNHVIYDYIYSCSEIRFLCEDEWIYPHSSVKISCQFDPKVGCEIILIEKK